jgi:spore germination cell wall hydrolase CwlJ-like protein
MLRSIGKRLAMCLVIVGGSFVAVDIIALHSITQALGVATAPEPQAAALIPKTNIVADIDRATIDRATIARTDIAPEPLPAPPAARAVALASAGPAPTLPLPQLNPVPILASLPQQDEPLNEPSLEPDTAPDAAPAVVYPMPAHVPLPIARPYEEPRLPSPSDRLGLDKNPKERARAEKCLSNAIYFESRDEPVRGQMAVAQVVLNRVFSPYYPKDVCSVVYQNANRHLACQFTFACDGKRKVINERAAWSRATRIAKQTLDGKLWLPDVGKSTHYHATYVHPNWVHEMKRLVRYGLHLFYRPYNWGDGSDEPMWGPIKKPVEAKAGTTGKTATAVVR